MLATENISKAFAARCEEIDTIKKDDLPEKSRKRLETIASIARDIRAISGGQRKAPVRRTGTGAAEQAAWLDPITCRGFRRQRTRER